MQRQQLPTESQVLEDEVLPGRERKALTNQPRKCRSDTIIAGIIINFGLPVGLSR